MHHCCIRSGPDDGGVTDTIGTGSIESCFQFNLQSSLSYTRSKVFSPGGEPAYSRGRGTTQKAQLRFILRAASVGKLFACSSDQSLIRADAAQRSAQVYERTSAPERQPWFETGQAFSTGLRPPFPPSLRFGGIRHERHPAPARRIFRIKSEDAPRRIETGQIKVLGVSPKRVSLVTCFWQWDWFSGRNQQNLVRQLQCVRDPRAPGSKIRQLRAMCATRFISHCGTL